MWSRNSPFQHVFTLLVFVLGATTTFLWIANLIRELQKLFVSWQSGHKSCIGNTALHNDGQFGEADYLNHPSPAPRLSWVQQWLRVVLCPLKGNDLVSVYIGWMSHLVTDTRMIHPPVMNDEHCSVRQEPSFQYSLKKRPVTKGILCGLKRHRGSMLGIVGHVVFYRHTSVVLEPAD